MISAFIYAPSSNLASLTPDEREFFEENRWQKLTRRLKEEPLIPIGS